ncbi:MAG: GNAT family N-acetyltransferase [Oscillospiraceae bacterium]|nr:GNAT family N-acetyltransferase [Oscillospiraceae bacterium]
MKFILGEIIMIETVTLKTKRLNIRPFTVKDAYAAAYNSRQPSIAEHMSDMVLADEKAGLEWINWIDSRANLQEPFQILAIETQDEKKCIGIIGVVPQPKIQGEVEILFSVADEFQGNGYATEAAAEMIKWFFSLKKDLYLCAIAKVNNAPSQKVVEKCGFSFIEEREILYDGKMTQFKYYKLS